MLLLVAVSGGIDSMCLAEKVRLSGEPFAVAHCNFGLRAEASDGDQAFVQDWALSHGVTFHVKRFETSAYAVSEGISVEMAARRLRYRWFGQLCREHGYSAVAVGHNANDNAETLILNLLRGTGLRGITGMKAEGFLPDPDFGDIPLLRPLLEMTREQIEAFAAEHKLSWREDATNAQNDFKRNKIRNLVFPVFREINPSFVQTLNRDMQRFADEQLSEEAHTSEPCVASLLVPPTASGSGPLPLMRPRAATGSEVCASPDKQGQGLFGEWMVTEEPWDGSQAVKQPEGMLILDADKLEPSVREAVLQQGADAFGRWETGDWIRPLGAPGRKKMQDWFTDHHIPAGEKALVPLLKSAADPHHVLAVAGCCIDHSVRVTAATTRILRISAKND